MGHVDVIYFLSGFDILNQMPESLELSGRKPSTQRPVAFFQQKPSVEYQKKKKKIGNHPAKIWIVDNLFNERKFL